MKLYKDENNNIYAYELDGSQDEYIGAGLVSITEEEADTIRNSQIIPLTQEELIEAVRVAIQDNIDTKAKSLGFSSGNALMLYAGFVNPFQPLAQVFASWEASVWVEAEEYKANVLAGNAPMLSPTEAVAMMPVYPQ